MPGWRTPSGDWPESAADHDAARLEEARISCKALLSDLNASCDNPWRQPGSPPHCDSYAAHFKKHTSCVCPRDSSFELLCCKCSAPPDTPSDTHRHRWCWQLRLTVERALPDRCAACCAHWRAVEHGPVGVNPSFSSSRPRADPLKGSNFRPLTGSVSLLRG